MPTGMRLTTTDTANLIRLIDEQIRLIDISQAPLVKRLGLNNQNSKFPFLNWGHGKIEWQQDTLSPQADAINGDISTTTETTVTVDNGAYFRRGHYFKIDSEWFWVESVSGNVLTVQRGFAGTTAATHSDDATVTILGIAMIEGDNYVLGNTTNPTQPYNYMQEIQESVQVTWPERRTNRYGIEDQLDYQIAKLIGGSKQIGSKGKAGILIQNLEKMAWHGKRVQGTTSVPAVAGGLPYFVTTHSSGSSSTEFTKNLIHTVTRGITGSGGMPDLLVTNNYGIEKIVGMYGDTIRTERSEEVGGYTIRKILTPTVELEILWSHLVPAGEAWVLDSNDVGWVSDLPFAVYEMPALGPYDAEMVYGTYSFVVGSEKCHGKITFSTSK